MSQAVTDRTPTSEKPKVFRYASLSILGWGLVSVLIWVVESVGMDVQDLAMSSLWFYFPLAVVLLSVFFISLLVKEGNKWGIIAGIGFCLIFILYHILELEYLLFDEFTRFPLFVLKSIIIDIIFPVLIIWLLVLAYKKAGQVVFFQTVNRGMSVVRKSAAMMITLGCFYICAWVPATMYVALDRGTSGRRDLTFVDCLPYVTVVIGFTLILLQFFVRRLARWATYGALLVVASLLVLWIVVAGYILWDAITRSGEPINNVFGLAVASVGALLHVVCWWWCLKTLQRL